MVCGAHQTSGPLQRPQIPMDVNGLLGDSGRGVLDKTPAYQRKATQSTESLSLLWVLRRVSATWDWDVDCVSSGDTPCKHSCRQPFSV
eukprot:748838-Amphidinium_carterae.1